MNFGQSISYCFQTILTLIIRGSRSEYWWFVLFCMILEFGGSVWDASMGDTVETDLCIGLRLLQHFSKYSCCKELRRKQIWLVAINCPNNYWFNSIDYLVS